MSIGAIFRINEAVIMDSVFSFLEPKEIFALQMVNKRYYNTLVVNYCEKHNLDLQRNWFVLVGEMKENLKDIYQLKAPGSSKDQIQRIVLTKWSNKTRDLESINLLEIVKK